MRILLILFTMYCFSAPGNGQSFGFAVQGAVLGTQVDGDNLRGFNRVGYRLGIEGSYRAGLFHEVFVRQSISSIGSGARNASLDDPDDFFIEMSLLTANILFGYAHHFSSGWDGNSKFRLTGGVVLHQMLNKEVRKSFNLFIEQPDFNQEHVKDRFMALHISGIVNLSASSALEFSIEHSLNNIAVPGSERNLNPYHIGLGYLYYL